MADNSIDRAILLSNHAEIEVELDDARIPDAKVTIKGYYFTARAAREAAKEFEKLADDLDAFAQDDLTEFKASRYGVTIDDDGDVELKLGGGSQVFNPSGVSELIDHLKKVRDRLSSE